MEDWELFYRKFKVNGVWGSLYRHRNGILWKWRGNIFTADGVNEARNYLRENKISPKS